VQKESNFAGEVFIGVRELDRSRFRVGCEVSWPVFISGSTLWRVATEHLEFESKPKRGTVLLLKSKQGCQANMLSLFALDSEVLFVPHSKFLVTHW